MSDGKYLFRRITGHCILHFYDTCKSLQGHFLQFNYVIFYYKSNTNVFQVATLETTSYNHKYLLTFRYYPAFSHFTYFMGN